MYTIPEALEIKFNKYQGADVKRHPILPLRKFAKNDRDIDITEEIAAAMINNLRIKRPVTIAHPDLDSAEAVGWIIPGTAEVSAFGEGKALYVGVEWSAAAKQAIEDKKYGYISPVFSLDYTDEAGNDIGASLLAAGLTNNPHWSEDQPELWSQFSAAFNTSPTATDADNNKTPEGEKEMQELEQAKARVQELEASVAELTGERDKLTEQLAEVKGKIEQFTAAGDDAEALKAEVKKLRGESLLAEFSGRLREKHLRDAEGKPTKLYTMAFEDPESFREIVSLIDTPEITNTAPVGKDSAEPQVQMTSEEAALAFARAEADKAPRDEQANVLRNVYIAKMKEIQNG